MSINNAYTPECDILMIPVEHGLNTLNYSIGKLSNWNLHYW